MSESWERLQRLKKKCESLNNQFGSQILSVDFNEKVVNVNDGIPNTNTYRDVSI